MSWLPFELGLALRYLRPKRTSVSFITLISVIGVMLGVAVLIVVISVMTGFHQKLQEKLFGFQSDLMVLSERNPPMFVFDDPLKNRLRDIHGVKGVSPMVTTKVMVQRIIVGPTPNDSGELQREMHVDALPLIGVNAETLGEVTMIPSHILAPLGVSPEDKPAYQKAVLKKLGSGDLFLDERFLVVGVNLAHNDSLALDLNDTLSIYTTSQLKEMKDAQDEGGGMGILPMDFQVIGGFDVGFHEFNSYMICSIDAAQELLEIGDRVTGVMVKVADPNQVDAVKNEMQKELGPNFRVKTWREFSPSLVEAVEVEKVVIEFLLFFIVIVAAFGITSSLIIFGVQKTRDIGLMKALGATNSQVSVVFLAQSFVVGALGVFMGLTLGLLLVEYRNPILRFMKEKLEIELFPSKIYHFYELPALVVTSDLVTIVGGSLIISMLAGLVPAWNAARLKSAEALRHE